MGRGEWGRVRGAGARVRRGGGPIRAGQPGTCHLYSSLSALAWPQHAACAPALSWPRGCWQPNRFSFPTPSLSSHAPSGATSLTPASIATSTFGWPEGEPGRTTSPTDRRKKNKRTGRRKRRRRTGWRAPWGRSSGPSGQTTSSERWRPSGIFIYILVCHTTE